MKKILMLMASVALLATACSKSDDNGGNDGGSSTKLAKPASFATTVSTTSSLTVTWGAVTNATGYTYKLGESGIETATSQTTASFSGLEEDTAYTIYVKATANGYEDSDWATYPAYTAQPSKGDDDLASLPASLRGTNYYLIQLDTESAEDLAGRIAADVRGAEVYLWADGNSTNFPPKDPSGSNWRGRSGESWFCIGLNNVGGQGWWAGGWCMLNDGRYADPDLLTRVTAFKEIDKEPENYVLHYAIKAQHNGGYTFTLCGGSGADGAIEVGVDKYNFERNGDWAEIEIPISEFYAAGLSFANADQLVGDNIFTFAQPKANPEATTSLEIDGVFIYKPAK